MPEIVRGEIASVDKNGVVIRVTDAPKRSRLRGNTLQASFAKLRETRQGRKGVVFANDKGHPGKINPGTRVVVKVIHRDGSSRQGKYRACEWGLSLY